MQKETARERDRSIRRVLVVVLVLNAAVALAKLVVGWLSASISMVAAGQGPQRADQPEQSPNSRLATSSPCSVRKLSG